MTNSALIELGKQCFIWGGSFIAIIGIVFIVGYSLIYKKVKKGEKSVEWIKLAIISSFVLYILVVVGATLVRTQYGFSSVYLELFSSYRAAWISASYVEWRNLILNILMFVPLGIYLPLVFKSLNKGYIVYGIGFVFSIGIESAQFLLSRGICEIDDVFNNTLGTMIGYGLYILLISLVSKAKRSKGEVAIGFTNRKILRYQFPLFITTVFLVSIFFLYQVQTYGNLSCQVTRSINMKDVNVQSNMELSDVEETAVIFQVPIYTEKELTAMGNSLLANFQTEIDAGQTKVYEDTVVFRSMDNQYALWMYKKGGGYWLINYAVFDSEADTSVTESLAREILEAKGIEIPELAEYESLYPERSSSGIVFTAEELLIDGLLVDGFLNCDINAEGDLIEVSNYIYEYHYVAECSVYSQQDIYEQICNGEFALYGVDELKGINLIVNEMELTYSLDTKGFYQPIYEVEILIDNESMTITLPAVM